MLEIHKQHPQDHLPEWIETTIIIAILLVVVHTVFEELAVIYHWEHMWHVRLALAAFAFDLIFSTEFAARTIITARRGHFKRYMLAERGWIDLLTSVPLLLLVSGPTAYFLLADQEGAASGMQVLVILKTAKAIRVTRVLRLLRVIKIFGRIQNTNSTMTNRHVATISTIAVVTLVLVLVMSQLVPAMHIGDHDAYVSRRQAEVTALFSTPGLSESEALAVIGRTAPDIIMIRNEKGTIVYENAKARAELKWTAYPDDALDVGSGHTMAISFHPADIDHAKLNLIILVIILGIIGAYMVVYTGIFARHIGDPIYIMERGMREWDYNLEVKISESHSTEEIFKLARVFNDRWLPLKNQILSYRRDRNQEKSSISVNDLF